jgi:RNase adapter protein RapZ
MRIFSFGFLLNGARRTEMQVTLTSFGYKHGLPEAETVLDVRFLPNPYYVPELKEGTGQEARVADYVLDSDAAREFFAAFTPFLLLFLQRHAAAGQQEIRLAVGCTGGRHRSVAVVEKMKSILAAHQIATRVVHRDMDRE